VESVGEGNMTAGRSLLHCTARGAVGRAVRAAAGGCASPELGSDPTAGPGRSLARAWGPGSARAQRSGAGMQRPVRARVLRSTASVVGLDRAGGDTSRLRTTQQHARRGLNRRVRSDAAHRVSAQSNPPIARASNRCTRICTSLALAWFALLQGVGTSFPNCSAIGIQSSSE
jgi:hypothetical protein